MQSNAGTQKKLVGVAVLVLLVLPALGWAVWTLFPSSSNVGYAPKQPLPFSHKRHVGDNKIQCQYCHFNAERSQHATVPPMSLCMNCHSVVRTDSPLIKEVTAAYRSGKPIEWVRVHRLPDYVYFPHKRHVQAEVSCETCHGNMKEMDGFVEQKSPLTMGWCMECHRGETTPKNVLAKFYPNMKDPHGPVANVNCTVCHN
jgi:hypothetical protein